MMNAAIVFPQGEPTVLSAATSIAQGVSEAGGVAELLPASSKPDLSQFQLVFVGITALGFSKNSVALSLLASVPPFTRVRVFCVHSGAGKEALEQAKLQIESNKLVFDDGLLLEIKGVFKSLGKGSLQEGDLARAKALGERGAAQFLGRRNRPHSEKNRISGYKK